MADAARPGKTRKVIDIDTDLIEWYDETYKPGTYSWLFNSLLKAFKNAHTFTPLELAEEGARKIKELIGGGDAEIEDDPKRE